MRSDRLGCGSVSTTLMSIANAVERMDPRHYLGASYYERALTGIAMLLVEKGVTTREGLEAVAGGEFPLGHPSAAGRANAPDRCAFQRGERVRVRKEYVAGHIRMPGYIRGKVGVIVREGPLTPFPDAHAHGVEAADEPTYDVQFRSADLWPGGADAALPRRRVPELFGSGHLGLLSSVLRLTLAPQGPGSLSRSVAESAASCRRPARRSRRSSCAADS